MQKGFTLIELLIVVVIVGVLVAVALPQYKRAVERGRAMEGIANLRAATDYLNAQYILTEQYPTSVPTTDLIKSKFFDAPGTGASSDGNWVSLSRNGSSGWNYALISFSQNGEVTETRCEAGNTTQCAELGLTGPLF